MRTVLVVDDVLAIRVLIRAELEEQGYKVYTADNGRECLDLLSRGLKPDVIVLDLKMPIMTGAEVMEALEQGVDHIPVVLMSGFFNKEEFQGVQAQEMLAKPFPMGKVTEAVQRAIHEAETSNNVDDVKMRDKNP